MRNFSEILNLVKGRMKKRVAVAAAHDEQVLEAIDDAVGDGIAAAILVGDKYEIKNIADRIGMDLSNMEIIHEPDNVKACRIVVSLASSGKADMVMKGIVDTATFLRAVLDKEIGLRTGKILSSVSLLEIPALDRVLILSDAAVNIAPDLNLKKQILENAVDVAHAIGIKVPKAAAIAGIEVVNPNMPETIDAAVLSKMNERGQITGCIVDGPLGLDNAISMEAAVHKGIKSPVAGNADIILVPNLITGNVMYKALTYLASIRTAAIVAGAAAPVILTSRTDNKETKYISIALASLAASNL